MMMTFLQVAAGGAIGSALRFGVTLGMARVSGQYGPVGFPLGVLTVNVVGSFAIGVLAVLAFHKGVAPLNPFLVTGILGGFTTFSTFSLEALTLYERGAFGAALSYVGLTLVLSLGAVALGAWAARVVVA